MRSGAKHVIIFSLPSHFLSPISPKSLSVTTLPSPCRWGRWGGGGGEEGGRTGEGVVWPPPPLAPSHRPPVLGVLSVSPLLLAGWPGATPLLLTGSQERSVRVSSLLLSVVPPSHHHLGWPDPTLPLPPVSPLPTGACVKICDFFDLCKCGMDMRLWDVELLDSLPRFESIH